MTKPRPDQHGLIRAKQAANEHKHHDADMTDRFMSADRRTLESECDKAGVAHVGRTDDQLIRTLITWHRQAVQRK